MVEKTRSIDQRGEETVRSTRESQFGLRQYLHDLIHPLRTQREADRMTAWGAEVLPDDQEAETAPWRLELDRLQQILEGEERKPSHQTILLSGLIPSVFGGPPHEDKPEPISSGLIHAERELFHALKNYEAVLGTVDALPLATLLYRFSKLFISRGSHGRAASYLQKAWAMVERADKRDDMLASLILVQWVETAHRSRDFFASDESFYTLLERSEGMADSRLPELGGALNGLANYFVSCAEHQKATLLFDRALTLFWSGSRENHPVFLEILNSAGSMYYGLQIFPEAHHLYDLAIQNLEKHGLFLDANTPILYHNSGLVCCHLQRREEARVRLVRSMITALQNGQEWVLWKSCYSLSYLFSQGGQVAGALFFGKLAVAITLQSWQNLPDHAQRTLDPYLAQHMEGLFGQVHQIETWQGIQKVVARHVDNPAEVEWAESVHFFSGAEKKQFELFLLLALQVKQISQPLGRVARREKETLPTSYGKRFETLEADFLHLLARWDGKKKREIFSRIT